MLKTAKTRHTYTCPKCGLYLAEVGRRQPFIRIRTGCHVVTPPGEAAQLKCTCGCTTFIMRASH